MELSVHNVVNTDWHIEHVGNVDIIIHDRLLKLRNKIERLSLLEV